MHSILAAIGVVFLGVGVVWIAGHLGHIPRYGDTIQYMSLAERLEVDAYRGIAYPLVLAAADVLASDAGAGDDLRGGVEPGSRRRGTPPDLVLVQILQLGVSLACLSYFLCVFVWRLERGRGGVAFAFLLALLFFDPLVAHFNLAVMTDSLALSASLVFTAALSDLVLRRRTPAVVAGGLLFAAVVVASGLRPEKGYVSLATAVLTLAIWGLWRSARGDSGLSRGRGLRMLVALALVVVAVSVSIGVQRRFQRPSSRWPVTTMLLHQRVVFPHLSRVYSQLSASSRALLTPAAARRYDSGIVVARSVIDKVTARDPATREQLTRDLVAVVLRERWGAIAVDVVGDSLENIFATASFYTRLSVLTVGGEDAFERVFHSDGTRWTYSRLALRRPRLSALYLSVAALALLAAVPLACVRVCGRSVSGGPDASATVLAVWTPVAVFSIVNAAAFAATADLVHIRYALFAHVAFVTVVFTGAWRWLEKSTDGTPGDA